MLYWIACLEYKIGTQRQQMTAKAVKTFMSGKHDENELHVAFIPKF